MYTRLKIKGSKCEIVVRIARHCNQREYLISEIMASSALDHDLHGLWCFIEGNETQTATNCQPDPPTMDPYRTEKNYGRILSQYMDDFERVKITSDNNSELLTRLSTSFFGGMITISSHAHLCDALNPVTFMRMLILQGCSPYAVIRTLFMLQWEELKEPGPGLFHPSFI